MSEWVSIRDRCLDPPLNPSAKGFLSIGRIDFSLGLTSGTLFCSLGLRYRGSRSSFFLPGLGSSPGTHSSWCYSLPPSSPFPFPSLRFCLSPVLHLFWHLFLNHGTCPEFISSNFAQTLLLVACWFIFATPRYSPHVE